MSESIFPSANMKTNFTQIVDSFHENSSKNIDGAVRRLKTLGQVMNKRKTLLSQLSLESLIELDEKNYLKRPKTKAKNSGKGDSSNNNSEGFKSPVNEPSFNNKNSVFFKAFSPFKKRKYVKHMTVISNKYTFNNTNFLGLGNNNVLNTNRNLLKNPRKPAKKTSITIESPFQVPEEDKIFDEFKNYACYQTEQLFLTENKTENRTTTVTNENIKKSKSYLDRSKEKKESIKNLKHIKNKNISMSLGYLINDSKKTQSNLLDSKSKPKNYLMGLKKGKRKYIEKYGMYTETFEKIYNMDDKYHRKVLKIKRNKEHFDLALYQTNLLGSIKEVISDDGFQHLTRKFMQLRRANGKKYELNWDYMRKLEKKEKNIIKDINEKYKQTKKYLKNAMEDGILKRKDRFQIKLPRLEFTKTFYKGRRNELLGGYFSNGTSDRKNKIFCSSNSKGTKYSLFKK